MYVKVLVFIFKEYMNLDLYVECVIKVMRSFISYLFFLILEFFWFG